MGYTIHQIQKCFNDIVASYKAMSFAEVPCSSSINYSLSGPYRYTDLVNTVNPNCTVRIELVSGYQKLDLLDDYKVHYLDLVERRFVNHEQALVRPCQRFYYIDSNYYTDDLSEVRHARVVSLQRYLEFWSHKGKACHLKIEKLSDRLVKYLRKAVEKKSPSCCVGNYAIKDIYFNYTSNSRKLVVVVKRDDSQATEALWFEPNLIPMYISNLIY